MSTTTERVDRWRTTVGLVAGPALALALWRWSFPALTPEAHRLLAVVSLVVIFWVTEAIPLPVTALLGSTLAILLGIAPATNVLSAFSDPVIFLFIGSFMVARAMQVHGLDRRLAYTLLSHPWVGGSTTRTLWAFGVIAWGLSMWMSNTACVAMLFPVACAMARAGGKDASASSRERTSPSAPRYATGLMLMLAYAASIGGLATPVGTPPNLIGIALIEQGLGIRVRFGQWMMIGLPAACILLGVAYGLIRVACPPELRTIPGQAQQMRRALEQLGPLTAGERNSLLAFAAAVALWVGPSAMALIMGASHPWVQAVTERLPEGIAALLAASLLFLLPTNWRAREFTLRWEQAAQIDWGTVLLFGGGIALGRLMFETGLASAIGHAVLGGAGMTNASAMTGASAGLAVILSETTSNTASANMVVPIMLSVASTASVGLSVAIAATLGASLGFMLPISTPPNAIVYGSKMVRLTDMVKIGLWLDLIGGLIVWAVSSWLVPLVFSFGVS